jgi:hypothetical protein
MHFFNALSDHLHTCFSTTRTVFQRTVDTNSHYVHVRFNNYSKLDETMRKVIACHLRQSSSSWIGEHLKLIQFLELYGSWR